MSMSMSMMSLLSWRAVSDSLQREIPLSVRPRWGLNGDQLILLLYWSIQRGADGFVL